MMSPIFSPVSAANHVLSSFLSGSPRTFKDATDGSVTNTPTPVETKIANVSRNLDQSLVDNNHFISEMENSNLSCDVMIDSDEELDSYWIDQDLESGDSHVNRERDFLGPTTTETCGESLASPSLTRDTDNSDSRHDMNFTTISQRETEMTRSEGPVTTYQCNFRSVCGCLTNLFRSKYSKGSQCEGNELGCSREK